MRSMQVLLAALLVVSAVALPGCSSSEKPDGAAAWGAKYSMGNLKSRESASIDKVYDATLKALDELKLAVLQKNADSMSGKIVARDKKKKKITVSLTATTDGQTKLTIKVGMLGDEAKSRLIYEQIKKRL